MATDPLEAPSSHYLDESTQETAKHDETSNSNRVNNHQDMPIERQLEIVDMNNPDMDMLEWIVRKTIPIPKQYYWETGNTSLPRTVILWHNIVGSLSHAIQWLDRNGKPLVDATGLSSSRFDYVLSTMTEEQKNIAAETARQRKQKLKQKHKDIV